MTMARREAERGCAEAQTALGMWCQQGGEGLVQDNVEAAAWFHRAVGRGLPAAQYLLAKCYYRGQSMGQSDTLAAKWGRKAADQGDPPAQVFVGAVYASGVAGVKKDLPLGERYLELSAAQGSEDSVKLLMALRKCVACGKLDVHHMICSRCYNRRYCDATCQLQH